MARARTAPLVRRAPAPRVPRRVSGPVARPVAVPGRPRPSTLHPQPHDTFGARLLALPDHRLLDMLLRSRAWIWLLGIALGGIVFMQVSLLGMNAGIGEAVQRADDLQHANAALEEQVATLSGGDNLHRVADALGLISPDAGDVGFVTAKPADVDLAVQRMTTPSDTARQTLATDGATPGTTTTTTTATTAAATVPTAVPTAVATAVVTPIATAVATATPVYTAAPTTTTTTTTPTSSGGAAATP